MSLAFATALGNMCQGKYVSTPTVNPGNSPYQVVASDSLIEFDNSSTGVALSALLPAAPSLGETHAFKWWKWQDANSVPPVVNGNGKQIEPWAGSIGGSALASTTSIGTQGGQGTWQYDGTQWVLIA